MSHKKIIRLCALGLILGATNKIFATSIEVLPRETGIGVYTHPNPKVDYLNLREFVITSPEGEKVYYQTCSLPDYTNTSKEVRADFATHANGIRTMQFIYMDDVLTLFLKKGVNLDLMRLAANNNPELLKVVQGIFEDGHVYYSDIVDLQEALHHNALRTDHNIG